MDIISFQSNKNRKTGQVTTIFPFTSIEDRHNSCKGCPLLPSINIMKDGKKVRLEGHYRTKKEIKKAMRNNPGYPGWTHLFKKSPKKTMRERMEYALQQLVESGKIPASPCYAWNGQVRMATSSIEKAAHKNPDKYIGLTGLKHQLKNRLWSQKIVRIGSIGEFARLPKEQTEKVIETIKEAGLTVIAYTHQWAKNPHLKSSFRASCDNKIALKKAIDKGWKSQFAIHESKITEREIELLPGVIGRVCDFYSDKWIASDKTEKNVPVTDCNNCRACKIEGDSPQVIIMPFHK